MTLANEGDEMKVNQLVIGEHYRLKSTPNYGWAKVVEILNPKTPDNSNSFTIVLCEHTVHKGDNFGFIRRFRLGDILPK